MTDEERLAAGLPPVPAAELPQGSEGPSEMPGDRADIAPPPELPPPVPGAAPPSALDAATAATAPPGMPAPASPPGLVPTGTHAVKGEQTVKTSQPSPLSQQGYAGDIAALQAQQKASGDVGQVNEQKAQIESDKASAIAERQRQDAADQAAALQAEQDRQAEVAKQRAAEWAQLQQDAKQMPPMFGVTQALEGALGLVGMLGALSQKGEFGRRNWLGAAGFGTQTLALIDSQVDRAQQAHQQQIEARYHRVALQDGYNEQVARAARQEILDTQAQRAQTYAHLGATFDAQIAALGPAAANAQTDAIRAQWDQRIAEAQQKAGKIQDVDISTVTHFVPGGAGTGGPSAGAGGAVVNLVKMAEDGAKRSEIVAAAQKLGLPEKAWKNQVDLAFSEREKGDQRHDAAEAKRAEDEEKRAVRDSKGNVIGYAAGARPDVKGIQDRIVNFESAEDFLETLLKEKKHLASGADWHNGVLAIAATTTANPSDATTKHEAGTLTNAFGLIDQDAVRTKLADIRKRAAAFQRQLRPVDGGAPGTPAAQAAEPAAKGFTPRPPMVLKGKRYVEIAPDNWQPQ